MNRLSIQRGFSLIELLLVSAIVGILVSVAIPSLLRTREAAEKSTILSTMRTIHTDQTMYLSTNGRYARLDELNNYMGNAIGITSGSTIRRNSFVFSMSPTPTLDSLKSKYAIIATKSLSGLPVAQYTVDQDGQVTAVIP